MTKLAPIVLFTYNRPWHTRQTLEALQKNVQASASDLFIYSDGAKNDEAKPKVKEVREYINSVVGFKSITLVERDNNWGLANSIIDGVTKIVNEYGKIIVVEDDLVTSPFFLSFMNDALEFYKDEKLVWHISGYTPPLNNIKINDHFFIKPTSCWGWATWSDRWSYFRKDTKYFLNKFDKKIIRDFNLNNSYDYYSHIQLNHNKKIDTWAIFWYATVYFNNGLSLHPEKSYVQNIGHDDSGTHCGNNSSFNVELAIKYEGTFPSEIALNNEVNISFQEYYKSLKKSLKERILSKLKKITGRK